MAQKSPANSKVKIFIGDTFTKSFEHRKVDLVDLNNPRGLPGVVTSATAMLWNVTETLYEPIGGVGIFTESCVITPSTGTGKNDVGTIISYTVDGFWTQVAADFSLLITFAHENGQVSTMKYRFRTTEKK